MMDGEAETLRSKVKLGRFTVEMWHVVGSSDGVLFEWDPHVPTSSDFSSGRAHRKFMECYRSARDAFLHRVAEAEDTGVIVVEI